MPPRLAVIIPTFNEAQALPGLLEDLARQTGVRLEIWVSDGGSTDDTVMLAQLAGAQTTVGRAGRGAQMNQAHALARAPLRLFLHADSRLHRADQLQRALRAWQGAGGRGVAGHFPLRFADAPAEHRHLFAFMEAKTRSGRPGTVHGDQGLLIHRADFDALGGYREQLPYFEDVYLSDAIFRSARWQLLPDALHTSARRFVREGVRQRYALMAVMMTAHALGDDGFFAASDALYRRQDQAQALSMKPLLSLLVERTVRQPRRWPKLLAYALQNAWQLPLMLRCRLTDRSC